MRTTLTLEEDVAAKLRAEARRSGKPFKQVVNEALRVGLNARRDGSAGRRAFAVRAVDLTPQAGIEFDNIEDLLDRIEGPVRR